MPTLVAVLVFATMMQAAVASDVDEVNALIRAGRWKEAQAAAVQVFGANSPQAAKLSGYVKSQAGGSAPTATPEPQVRRALPPDQPALDQRRVTRDLLLFDSKWRYTIRVTEPANHRVKERSGTLKIRARD